MRLFSWLINLLALIPACRGAYAVRGELVAYPEQGMFRKSGFDRLSPNGVCSENQASTCSARTELDQKIRLRQAQPERSWDGLALRILANGIRHFFT